ncbi:MAG: Trk system potassium transporter TrkA [Alphaproteobacteria bacterium CG_4_9_14_3_um_filter_47_13]|nr:MAG: Trk system potassium transporter TrkA [Alphaproteobacteria bacterium CG_4_9_14_3_um_filter_47_13]
MRVIICGAGQVGYSIAAYLAREENDVTVIDINPHLIAQINEELDVSGIVGHASTPDVLEQAGASETDLIIAVTHVDEVNMVACQVAHSLFNVPKKIARVRAQSYLDPVWANLFSRSHLPIDAIISPEVELARAIDERLSIPGTTNLISLAEERVHLAGVVCKENCPVLNTQLRQFSSLFPDLPIKIALVLRGNRILIPDDNDQIMENDEVYFFTDAEHLQRVMAAFGHEEKKARHICIMGGGSIGLYLARMLQREQRKIHIKIIESNEARAQKLSEELQNIIIIHGDGLQNEILQEANMANTETLIAVTNDDETNILGSLLAKQYGCERVITLINKPTYRSLVTSLGIDAVVSPRASTVSTIMQYVRRGRVKAVHTLRDGVAEVIEAEVLESSALANVTMADLHLPDGVLIGAIVRKDVVLMPAPEIKIIPGDHIIVMAKAGKSREVEHLFTVQVDLF